MTQPNPLRNIVPKSSRLILAIFLSLLGSPLGFGQANTDTPEPESFGKLYKCKPGPWGDLEYYYIYLEAPDRLVENFPAPNTIPRWVFPGGTATGLRMLFENAGLPLALQDYLLDPKHVVDEEGLFTVFPPLPDLLAMKPEQRSVIYAELAKSEENEFHSNPVFITSGSAQQWLAQSRVRQELRDMIQKMCYMRGAVLAFSDVSAVLGMAESTKEAHDLLKTMTRTRSLVLRLRVKSDTDLQSALGYWTGTNRNKDITPIVMSAAETADIERLDCIHLLPSLPRRYLYSYPPAELAILGRMPDCHWTSLNFFNYKPREYFLDTRLASVHVLEEFAKVEPPYAFGDVFMFLNQDGNAVHSCVHIADDIVYTKNGENMASPWLLMKRSDVERIYSNAQSLRIQAFRLKKIHAQE